MLRKVRRTLGVLCLVFVTLLFVDFTGVLHAWLGWMAKIQFLPALFALNAGVIVCLILLTLVAGRVYCSVICPLGVFQDVVARLARGRKKMPYTYSKPKSWLRYGVLVIYVLAVLLGVHAWWLCSTRMRCMAVQPTVSCNPCGCGATICWLHWPSVWIAMRSILWRSGLRVCLY